MKEYTVLSVDSVDYLKDHGSPTAYRDYPSGLVLDMFDGNESVEILIEDRFLLEIVDYLSRKIREDDEC